MNILIKDFITNINNITSKYTIRYLKIEIKIFNLL